MDEPDYDSYTLEQLQDVEAHIDREAYPQRYARIMEILNDEVRLKILEHDHAVLLERRGEQNEQYVSSFSALVYWLYGTAVLVTGYLYGRHSDTYIESIPLRIILFLVFIVVGYQLLSNRDKKQ